VDTGAGGALSLHSSGSVVLLYDTIAAPDSGSGAAVGIYSGTVGITDTIISGYGVGISLTAGSAYQDYNLLYGNTPTSGPVAGGAHNASGNPHFINPAAQDYRIAPPSSAIDKATDVGIDVDYFGNPRPSHGGFDIGYAQSIFTPRAYVPFVSW
jgi:hypothetical protein